MSRYANDDDSFEAEEYRSYNKLCPVDVDKDVFIDASRRIINDFKTVGTPPTAKEINRQLSSLRAAIKGLSPEAKAVLRAREHDDWQTVRSQGEAYDDVWLQRAEQIGGGGVALGVLKKTSAGEFTRKRWTAVKRIALIARAIFLFKCGGEKIEDSNSKLVNYIQWLLGEVGLEDEYPKKALNDFLKEHAVEPADGNPSRKVYRITPRTS